MVPVRRVHRAYCSNAVGCSGFPWFVVQVSYPQTKVFRMCLDTGFGYTREPEFFLLHRHELDSLLSVSLLGRVQVTVESLLP